MSRPLREQVVGDAHREFTLAVQFLDDGVVVGIVLVAAARIYHARYAEPVDLAQEMPRRILLIIRRQLRSLRQCRVENAGVWFRHQQACRLTVTIAHDLCARRFRRSLGVTDCP
jgi:hypothetical protein